MLHLHPKYTNAELLRSRDPSRLSTCDVVVDVGGEYNAAAHRYDHHQRPFDATFPGRPTTLSSAGLVWLHFGKAIVAASTALPEDGADVQCVWQRLYTDFVEAIDANDNGISVYDAAQLAAAGVGEKRFRDGGLSVTSVVGDMNLDWNEALPDDAEQRQAVEDARFNEASQFIGDVFRRKLGYYARSWLPARAIVHAAYAERKKYDARGRIMVLEQALPWKTHLLPLEVEAHKRQQEEPGDASADNTAAHEDEVLYVLYPESKVPGAKWRIQAVPRSLEGFENRKSLPKAWRALRDEQLDQASGIPGGVFVHASGFIGGNKTWEGVLAMAQAAVDN